MTRQNGFTLVELAIVLMIIGLLIGGILKGQEIITNARTLSLTRQLSSYETTAITFKDIYGATPGDMINPSTRIPNCTTAPCNIVGDGNGKIETVTESSNFWLHLAKTNLITGIDTSYTGSPRQAGVDLPTTPFGGALEISYAPTTTYNGHNINNQEFIFPLSVVGRIDRKIDDGNSNTGGVYIGDCDEGWTDDYGASNINMLCNANFKSEF